MLEPREASTLEWKEAVQCWPEGRRCEYIPSAEATQLTGKVAKPEQSNH